MGWRTEDPLRGLGLVETGLQVQSRETQGRSRRKDLPSGRTGPKNAPSPLQELPPSPRAQKENPQTQQGMTPSMPQKWSEMAA